MSCGTWPGRTCRSSGPARQVFTAIVHVLASGCAWRVLPPSFGVPFQTAHRRFTQWTKAGVWPRRTVSRTP